MRVRRFSIAACLGTLVALSAVLAAADEPWPGAPVQQPPATAFRPPSVPLVTYNPYLSIWSAADRLTDDNTRHWTRHEHPLVSLIRVDGKTYRLMGKGPKDTTVPPLPQVGLQALPTRTIYDFDDGRVHVTLTFMTAALPDDLEALSRPLSYITWQVRSVDGAAHELVLYDSTSALAVNRPDQKVVTGGERAGPLTHPARWHRGPAGAGHDGRRYADRLGLRLPRPRGSGRRRLSGRTSRGLLLSFSLGKVSADAGSLPGR